jgi:uncharacterized protein YndB with AHSA1/START domain
MNISYIIKINSPPERVFYWIGDPERAQRWMSSVSKTEILRQTPNMVGTTFRETVEEDGQGTELVGEVTAFQPNQLLAFHLEGDFNVVDVEYRLKEFEGQTRVTHKSHIRFKSFVKVLMLFAGFAFKKKILGQLQQEFAELKRLCEEDVQ